MAISSRRESPLPRLPELASVPVISVPVIGKGAARGPCRSVRGMPHTPNPLSWAVTDDAAEPAKAARGVGGGSGFTGAMQVMHPAGASARRPRAMASDRPGRRQMPSRCSYALFEQA